MTDLNAKQGIKVMVLMTDGENTVAPNGGPVNEPGDPSAKASVKAKANELTEKVCTNSKAYGVDMFTISFMIADATTQTMLDGCASSTGQSYNADSSSQLNAAFDSIGQKLAKIRLTQ